MRVSSSFDRLSTFFQKIFFVADPVSTSSQEYDIYPIFFLKANIDLYMACSIYHVMERRFWPLSTLSSSENTTLLPQLYTTFHSKGIVFFCSIYIFYDGGNCQTDNF